MKEDSSTQAKVSLEDLLRLKRAERPSDEFWVQFETELKRKQLAAAVERAPSWGAWLQRWRWTWVGLPVGAAAAWFFTWSALSVPPSSSGDALVAEGISAEVSAPVVASAPASTPQVGTSEKIRSEVIAPVAVATATPSSSREAALPAAGVVSEVTAFLAGLDPQVLTQSRSLSLALPEPEVELKRGTFQLSSLTAAAQASEAVAPAPAESQTRKARLTAYVTSSLGSEVSETSRTSHSRDRVASRLSEQALQDSMRRLEMGGNHLSIRF